ncbi:MAG TPA: endolytic transglycosylase MltG [Mycobacteriales bacterium]|nr:endolytic transglycosylase MltG [Mycobacteriales bacterium]
MPDRGLAAIGFDHGDMPGPPTPRPRRRLAAPLALGVAIVLIVSLSAVGLAAGVHGLSHLFGTPDYSGAGYGRVVVAVVSGETATQIGQALDADGVVASVQAFTDAANNDPRSRLIAPGYYLLHKHMKASLALDLLLAPGSAVGRVIIPEGFTVAEILARLAARTSISRAALAAAAADPSALGLPGYSGGRLEGFCFPATYDFPPGTTATAALRAMVAKFTAVAAQLELTTGAARLGQSPYTVLSIASIVQREGFKAADLPKIARVFDNRLARGMPLQSDATLYYVLGPNHGPLTAVDLTDASPYNTRIHAGLPPTPIANPGTAALQAALDPAPGPWLYFTTMDKAGDTAFETTYAQHEQDAAIAASRGIH